MKLKQIASALMMLGLSPLALADFIIQDIRVEGLQRTEPSTVFSYLPVKVGDNFNDARSEEIIRNLYATGFFDDVRVETTGNQVLLTVIERPTISTLNITGAKMLQNDAIKKNLESFGLAQSQYFNPAVLNQAVAGLKAEYISRGKKAVKITPTVTKLARNRVSIDIAIDEGKSTKITEIEFEGNEHYSDRTLRKQMSLSEGGMWTWLTKSNQFNEQKFSQDLQKINEFYQNRGYFGFRIANTDVQSNDDDTKQTIKITVDEGERFRWGKITIEGDTREVPKEDLYKLLKMKEGKWFDRELMVSALENMQKRMGTAGYAFSEINVRPVPNLETKTVDFVLDVDAGRKVYVNEIHISGNNKTRDEVVRRELRQMEAAPYDASKLQRSKERVELLGYFDDVQFDPKPVAGTPDQVDLNMTLKERATGSLDLSAGWVQDTGIVVSMGVAQDNLFGTGKSASARVSRSKTTLNGSLSFTDPYFTPDGVSLGYDIYGKKYDPRKATSSSKQYKTQTVGAGLRMGVPITEYDRVNFGLAVEHMTVNTYTGAPKRYREFMSEHTGDEIGKWSGMLYKGTLGWGRNKTDNALWPTRGYQTGVNAEIALPGSDLKYYTVSHNQTWFFPLSKDFTFMVGGAVGYGNSYGSTKSMPFFENFYGGGLGSVRGYESGTLGPKVYDEYGDKISYGGNKKANVSAELMFPMPGVKDARTVRLSLFADAGSVWDDKTYTDSDNDTYYSTGATQNVYGLGSTHKSTFKEELRYSAGLAVSWLSPLGPMKFSYAYPINKKEGDEIQRFQFQLGTTF
ncbi:outer membrane protein assembly factor BamA [Neisseria perflava]|uniref:outer membrane protein assembly factor BamA n=1 Tax=Neisseria perflava TaxID=33053 RepID=UPI0020A158DB|nr:outer membrane protein assembly factor BamA [Neisseria perflava]MCP1660489.1 outer membrane protein insertion porin family [Neisseria perflava]MCP1772038.1 outer membrane protein insertion porin family [Neisseria perflava]